MRIAAWNVNGIRSCCQKGLADWMQRENFEAILLQEVRADSHQIPDEIQDLGQYYQYWNAATSKKGYSGTGILTHEEALQSIAGIGVEEFDIEGRVLSVELSKLWLVSAYFPNSQDGGKRIDYKIAFCKAMQKWLNKLRDTGKPVVLAGDFNIAHEDIDLARPNDNHDSPGFLPAERKWMTAFIDSGWTDTYRALHPDKVEYSWWSARTRARERNVGWRIDYHTVHKDDLYLVTGASIQTDVMGSDHCPVVVELKL
ncbi:MAG: exodeoxyribonuclease III [Bdellovibrionota bacterium]